VDAMDGIDMEKTWNIGESCQGGIITAIIEPSTDILELQIKGWDYRKYKLKTEDQPDAPVLHSIRLSSEGKKGWAIAEEFLTDYTTPYYASQVLDWVASEGFRLNKHGMIL
jgi:hypothetical protein